MHRIAPHRRQVVSTYYIVVTPSQAQTSSDTTITLFRTLTTSSTRRVTATPTTTDLTSGLLFDTSVAPKDTTSAAAVASSSRSGSMASSAAPSAATSSGTSSASLSKLTSSKSTTNSNLGLAIGIPIAVVAALALIVFGLVYLKKRRGPTYSDKVTFDRSIKHPNAKLDPEQGSFDRTLTGTDSVDKPKPNFLRRLSKMMPETPLEFMSPVFLRRFNLSKKPAAPDPNKKEAPAHFNPYERSETDAESTYSDTPDILHVTKPYVRRLGDEISVCIGDRVKILSLHSDGWATVKIMGTSQAGVIPLMCVRKKTDRFP